MLKDRLSSALKAKNISQAEFIRLLNVGATKTISQAAVSKWFTGKTLTIRSDLVIKAAQILSVSPDWLNNGHGPMQVRESNVTDFSELSGQRKIPVISYVHAGYPNSSQALADEYIDATGTDSHLTYALRVKGDSMLPVFQEGDLIVVDPSTQPKPGDYVVARFPDAEESTFKKLRYTGIDKFGNPIMELIPLNPDYPTFNSSITPFEVCGKVIEHRSYFK